MPEPDRPIKWSKACIECQRQNGGTCPWAECAAVNYDENGNEVIVQYDGDYQCIDKTTQS